MPNRINIGWAQTDITPERPFYVTGQLYSRISTYIHDPLTATCLVLENGDEQMTFVSLDMPSVSNVLVQRIQESLDIPELNLSQINFNATHTHNSTSFGARKPHTTSTGLSWGDLIGDPELLETLDIPENLIDGEELIELFVDRVSALITDAWMQRAPGGISAAQDYAVVAFNRRPVFRLPDGSTEARMYGNCSEDQFIGLEGYSDHTVDLLYTWDEQNNLTGVVVDVPCPSQVCELHRFISADYWGYARSHIRDALGNVYVLPMCGAAGDQNPLDLIHLSKTNVEPFKIWNAQQQEAHRNFDMFAACDAIGLRIADAVRRGYTIAQNTVETRPVFRYRQLQIDLNIRQVTEQDYQDALREIESISQEFSREHRMKEADITRLFLPGGVIARWKRQQNNPVYAVTCHILRLGSVVFASNPFELFTEYGLRIRARCRARQAFIVQLSSNSGGPGGYLPTHAAIAGGSYSSKPASTTVGPEAGDQLTHQTIQAINELFS